MLTEPATDHRPVAAAGGRRWWWWVAPPLVLAVLGGWLVLQRHGLWYDEVYTAEVAPESFGRLLRAMAGGHGTIPYLRDAPPSYNGPYYLVVHLWLVVTRLGADEVGLRLFSLLCSVAAMAMFTRAVARLADRRVAVVAGLVAAANPFVVQFSAEARGYSLALLAVSAAVLGFARWLDGEPGALRWYGLAAAGAGLAHWFAFLVPVGLAVAAIVLRRRAAARFVAVTGAAALPVLGVVALAVGNGVGASGAEWLRGVGGRVPWLVLWAWSGRFPPLVVVTAVAAVVGLVARAGAHRARVAAAAWVGVPVAVVACGELIRPVFVDRYLLAATLGLAVLVALGVTGLRHRAAAGVALVAVLFTSLAATGIEVNRPPKDDTRGAVALVAARHRGGEPVVAAARWDALGVDHYVRTAHGELTGDLVLPGAGIPASSRVWVVRRAAGGVKGDVGKLGDLDRELGGRGLRVADEVRFDGRYADTLVQLWER